MIYVAFNIGYYHSDLGGGTLSTTPELWQFDTFKEFANIIRRDVEKMVMWAGENYVPKSTMRLYCSLYEDCSESEYYERSFVVNMKNVREYKVLINQGKNPERSVATGDQSGNER